MIQDDGLLRTLCGTPAYVAPEILTRRGYNGSKADLWSCGVILFVLTARYLAFNDANLMMLYKKIYKGEYQFAKWMSVDLRRLLTRLMDTNLETRITIDDITRSLWFRKVSKGTKFYECEDEEFLVAPRHNARTTTLNAFDLILFSSGLNFSPFFDNYNNLLVQGEKLVVTGPPVEVMDKIQETMKEDNVRIKK